MPVTPLETTSGFPPTSVAITGLNPAMASIKVNETPSLKEGNTNTSKALINLGTSLRFPVNTTISFKPKEFVRFIRFSRSAPSPIIMHLQEMLLFFRLAMARIKNSIPFTLLRRATTPTTKSSDLVEFSFRTLILSSGVKFEKSSKKIPL